MVYWLQMFAGILYLPVQTKTEVYDILAMDAYMHVLPSITN